MDFIETNWLLILLAVAGIAIVTWYVFHASRKTRVTGARRDVLDEGAAPAARNQALIDAAPVAAPDGLAGAGEAVEAVARSRAAAGADDLTRIKGVGPKLATQLGELGVTGYAQIAGWSEADIDRVDAKLGRFQGRIRRDSWVGQAKLLAAGDSAGFAAKFGNTD